jgi:pimeloyl-ACP methyl ester carboxylesterase
MSKLFIRELGNGTPVVLLHGFPFDHTIWNSFAKKLSEQFHVLTPDLPGFGQSPLHSPLTITNVAQVIIDYLVEKKISRSVLIGHSLGGYVALEMAKKSPDLFSSLGLFHSTAYADSDEKKESRNKVLEFIDKHGVQKFTSNFIGPLFADEHHPAVNEIRSISMRASAESVKAYTIAMRDRSDRTAVLAEFSKPILFIAGEKDGGIPVESIKKQAQLSLFSETHILTSVAHMGMVESEHQTLAIVETFIKKSGVTSQG